MKLHEHGVALVQYSEQALVQYHEHGVALVQHSEETRNIANIARGQALVKHREKISKQILKALHNKLIVKRLTD